MKMKTFKWYSKDIYDWTQYHIYNFKNNAFRLRHKEVLQIITVLGVYDAIFNKGNNLIYILVIFILYLIINSINSGHHRNWKRVKGGKKID